MKIHTCALLVTLAPLSVVTSSQGSKPILPGVASLAAQDAVSPAEAHEELLGELPEGSRLFRLNLVVSRAGRHAAWVAKQGVAETVVVNGRPVPGPVVEDIDHIVISYAGDHVAWSGKRGKSWVVILDGQPVGPEYESVEHLAFAPDGRLTFVARRTDKTGILVDGVPGPASEIGVKSDGGTLGGVTLPPFDSEGAHVIYAAMRGEDEWSVMLDGKPVPGFAVSGLQIGPVFDPNLEGEQPREEKGGRYASVRLRET